MKLLYSAFIVAMLQLPCIALPNNNYTDQIQLFRDSKPLEIILKMDVKSVLNDKSEDPEYTPAQLTLILDNNQIRLFDIKIKPRGGTRRIANICEFPPLMLNLQKKTTIGSVFEGQDKLKMVTHCNESDDYQNYTLLEYLAYKSYNTLTDYSYRVRMVNVIYRDTERNYPDISRTGFLIEDDELLAKRLHGQISDKLIWSSDSCDQKVVDTFAFFQFMIGNTDWWIQTRHNVDIFSLDNNVLIPIPFDFDGAGIINTPYAKPSLQLPITSVRNRFFKDNCNTSDISDYDEVISLFNEKKDEIVSLYQQATYLDNSFRRSALRYVNNFYDIINDPKKFNKFIDQSCEFFNTPPDHAPTGKRLIY